MFGRWFKRGKAAKPHGDPLYEHGASVDREEPAAAGGQETAPHEEASPDDSREQQRPD